MSAAVTKAGPYYSTGSISFSSLRTNFKETASGAIKFSELLRNTTTTDTNPVVPDATENASIPTSASNFKASNLRNSIKYYYITQTGTDVNFDIDAQSWNGNLTKNIRKWMYINGVCGSNSVSSVAADFNATTYNMTIDVSGAVYGAAGRGGGTGSGAPDPSGESAGTALNVTAPGSNTVVYVRTGAKIYGGGGGGERGAQGSNGNGGRCCNRYETRGCGGAPGCNGGDSDVGYRGNCGGCCQNYRCGWGTCCSQNWACRDCESCYNTSGGTGGAGGTGGLGRGYNNLTGSTSGAGGSGGSSGGGCGANGGGTGETGGPGGDWASAGGNTNNSGNGGGAGRAISGSNYSVTGVINADTVKGAYL